MAPRTPRPHPDRRRATNPKPALRAPATPTAPATDDSWASSPGVRRSMRSNKGRDTTPELRLRRLLHKTGLRYRVNRRPERDIPRTADVVFPRLKLAVFVDGCYWHGCPLHGSLPKTNARFWADKISATRDRDRETDRLLRRRGWTVLRFWEHEDVDHAAEIVHSEVDRLRVEKPAPTTDHH